MGDKCRVLERCGTLVSILGPDSGRDVYDRRNMKMSLKGVDESQNNANTIEAKETVAKALHGQRFPMSLHPFLRCELFSKGEETL